METLFCGNSEEWRQWLRNNGQQISEIWLVFLKKDKHLSTLTYNQAVEEALCFGWIDSVIRKIDDVKYARKFTPRKETSKWSESNKKRVKKLIEAGRIEAPGMAVIKAAKANGNWDKSDRPDIDLTPSKDFLKALDSSQKAKVFFETLAPSHKTRFIGWINHAKREETKQKRIKESIALLEKGEKLGLK